MSDTRAVVGEVFTHLGRWDADAVGTLFAEEVEWFVPTAPALPWGGSRARRGEVAEFFKTMWSYFHIERSELKIDQIVVEGEDAVALGTFSHVATTTDTRFTTEVALHFRVRNGLVVRLYLYEDTYAVAKAFGVIADAAGGGGI